MTKQVQPVEKMLAKMRTDYKTSTTSGKQKLRWFLLHSNIS